MMAKTAATEFAISRVFFHVLSRLSRRLFCRNSELCLQFLDCQLEYLSNRFNSLFLGVFVWYILKLENHCYIKV